MPQATDRLHLIAAAAAALLLTAACGQKGPLYLPGERSDRVTEIPLPDDGPADDEGAEERSRNEPPR